MWWCLCDLHILVPSITVWLPIHRIVYYINSLLVQCASFFVLLAIMLMSLCFCMNILSVRICSTRLFFHLFSSYYQKMRAIKGPAFKCIHGFSPSFRKWNYTVHRMCFRTSVRRADVTNVTLSRDSPNLFDVLMLQTICILWFW